MASGSSALRRVRCPVANSLTIGLRDRDSASLLLEAGPLQHLAYFPPTLIDLILLEGQIGPCGERVSDVRLQHDEKLTLGGRRLRVSKDVAQPEEPQREILQQRHASPRNRLLVRVESTDDRLLAVEQPHLSGGVVPVDDDALQARAPRRFLHLHVQVDEVEARRSGGVGHGLREKRRHDLHDDSSRVELGDRVSGEVADLDGDVRSDLNPTLLAALHGNLRVGDGLTEPFVLQQAEELSELREVDLVGGVDVFVELIENSVCAQAESRLLHSTRSGAPSTTSSSLTTATRLLSEEDVPVQPQLTCLRHVQFEEDRIDLDLSRPQRGWTRRLFGPGSSAGPRGRRIEHASLLRRLFDDEVAIR